MELAFIGAGYMGYGIALNLLKNNHRVRVIPHRNRERIEKLVAHGALQVDSYEQLLEQAEAVVSCVSTADQFEKVVDLAEPFLAKVGDKTLVDTLSPAVTALSQAAEQGQSLSEGLVRFEAAAKEGMESTKDLLAKMGRASRLGERSIGHVDAGATSCYFILKGFAAAAD